MKKVYMLLVAVMIFATAVAQETLKTVNVEKGRQVPYTVVRENPLHGKMRSTMSDELWMFYPHFDALYQGAQELHSGGLTYLKSNTKGLQTYSDGYGHSWVHSVSQTFDLTSSFFDDVIGDGRMSFKYTENLTIDSIEITGVYIRDEDYEGVDTLLIGIMTFENNAPVYTLLNEDGSTLANSCFLGVFPDTLTGLQEGVQNVFKIPLTADDISQPGDQPNSVRIVSFAVPVNVTTSKKLWNVAYTFKSGQGEAYDDTLKSRFNAYFVVSADPNYFFGYDNPLRCSNISHGQLCLSKSNGEYISFYYPGFALGSNVEDSDMHFSENIYVKVSCSECEIVNVPEIEKTNPTIYPNPATEKFTVNLGNDETASLQLFNIVGQQVYSGVVTGSAEINTSRLNSGVYMLKINQNGKVYTSKVVVK